MRKSRRASWCVVVVLAVLLWAASGCTAPSPWSDEAAFALHMDQRGKEHGFTGAPTATCKAGHVVSLGLRGQNWTDLEYAQIAKLGHLEVLALSETNVRDEHLRSILANARRLRRLYLEDTRVTSAGLAGIENARELEWLGLDETDVDGDVLPRLRGLARLEHLGISGTRIGDADAATLAELIQVKRLVLGGPRWSDDAIRHLGRMRGLDNIFIDEGCLSGAGVRELRRRLPETEVVVLPPPGAAGPVRGGGGD